MAIAGLTDRFKTALDTDNRGRAVRLGTLQKGEKQGHGTNIKLFDREYFIFRPNAEGAQATRMITLFEEAYGKQPKEIPDVRIPVSLAGNFNIEDCAWLTAGKHTEKGSMFMARSDGEWVLQARDVATGRVKHYEEGELAHDAVTKNDSKGKPGYTYGNNIYPWQQSMAIDLILPHFNRLLHKHRIAGQGVITLITHSTYDIPTLIGEYYAILNEWAALMADPRDPHEQDRARRHLALRNLPLRLFRRVDHISTPNYMRGQNGQSAPAGERLNSTRSLLHWQVAPDFAASMQEAIDKRTEQFMLWVASTPYGQLTAGERVAQANAALFGDPEPARPQLPAVASGATNLWEEWANDEATVVDGDTGEILPNDETPIPPGNDPGPIDWRQQALTAATLDGFCSALFQMHKDHFKVAPAARRFYEEIIGKFDPAYNKDALATIEEILAEDGDIVAAEAQTPAVEPQRPVQAEIKANGGKSNGKPNGNGQKKWPNRPFDAPTLKAYMATKIVGDNGRKPSDKQRTYALASLASVALDDAERHTITLYLFGKESTTELTSAEASAIIDWVSYKEIGPDDWQPNGDSMDEAKAVIRQWQIDQGQLEMFPAQAFSAGLSGTVEQ